MAEAEKKKKKRTAPEPLSMKVVAMFVALFAVLLGTVLHVNRTQTAAAVARETPRESDVLLVSFPKSGSHWVRFLVLGLLDDSGVLLRKNVSFELAEKLVPDLELGPNRQRFAGPSTSPFSPRVFKSHQPWLLDPVGTAEHMVRGGDPCGGLRNTEKFQCLCPNCPGRWKRLLYVVRDGRAALCSYYAFQKQLGNFEGTYEAFIASDKSKYGYDWAAHAESFVQTAASAPGVDVHVVRYEDLKEEPLETLRSLGAWLRGGKAFDDEQLARVADFGSLKKMRQAGKDGGTPPFDKLYPEARGRGFNLVREGRVDGWRDCPDVDFETLLPGWRAARAALGYDDPAA